MWFEEDKKAKKEESLVHASSPSPQSTSFVERDPEKELEAFKKDFERKLKIAVWDPTPENVLAFQQVQLIALEKSIEFSRVWQQNLLVHPHLDSSIDSLPSSQYGTKFKKSFISKKKKRFCKL